MNSSSLGSMETGEQVDPFESAFSDKAIRQGFIRKVFAILSVQLIVTFVPCILFANSVDAKLFAAENWWILILALVIQIATLLPMVCARSLRTKVPINYILLTVFTATEATFFAFIGAVYDPEVVSIAVAITAGVVLGLTLFALQTKIDFTICNGLIFCIFLCMTLASFALIFYRGPNRHYINIVYCAIFAIIFSFFIIIDIQMIVGGGRSLEISPEEYIFAALILYVDIMRLFLYILQIVAEAKK